MSEGIEFLRALLVPAIKRASALSRIQRLIEMRGADEVNRLMEEELERRIGAFVGTRLTPRVQRQIEAAIYDGIEEVARLGADA